MPCGAHGLPDELLPASCICYGCYSGPSCDQLDENCLAGDTDAIVSMNAEWFRKQGAPPFRVSLGTGMPYRGSDIWIGPDTRTDTLARMLDSRLRRLHAIVDNVPGGHASYPHLLLGAGAAQLLSAALFALTAGRRARRAARRARERGGGETR
jgi:hypothetical protein